MRLAIFNNIANYSQKVERHLDTYDEYIIAAGAGNSFGPWDGINFNYADGIATEQVINLNPGTPNFSPDYLLVLDDSDNIVQRWFVVESMYLRALQYRLTLRRDIIADHWNETLDKEAIITRGWATVGNVVQSPIANPEGFTMSQVKQSETMLKDKTGSAWVVGYLKDENATPPQNIVWRREIEAANETALMKQILDNDHGITVGDITSAKYRTFFTYGSSLFKQVTFNSAEYETADSGALANVWEIEGTIVPDYLGNVMTSASVEMFEDAVDAFEANPPFHRAGELDDYLDKYFYGSGGRVYKLTRKELGATDTRIDLNDKLETALRSTMAEVFRRVPSAVKGDWNPADHDCVIVTANNVQYVRDYVTTIEYSAPISSNRARLNDRPWSMFAMPLSSISVKVGTNVLTTDDNIAINFAKEASAKLGDLGLDIQLLPYCPIQQITVDGGIDLTGHNAGETFDYVTSGGSNKSVILWARESSGRVSIPYSYSMPRDPEMYKIEAECKKFRLCAPNYSSAWDFTPALNGGITGFDVDFTYEPNQTYIRVAPKFSKFYGKDFGDSRGLIISTNLSLPKITDNWTNYQLQNINYQKIFDRDIATMEMNRNISAISSVLDIGLGAAGIGSTLSSAASIATATGGMLDSKFASEKQIAYNALQQRINAGPQALMGAAQIGVETINDVMAIAQQQVAIEDAKAKHTMQLGNIQAQPQTITQIGAFNINNKLFPILEIYDATGGEKRNLLGFLKYRSMNIGRYGTVREYTREGKTWVEASLLDTFEFSGDAHELATLKNDLATGVFIVKE